jgi:hypothetical protein
MHVYPERVPNGFDANSLSPVSFCIYVATMYIRRAKLGSYYPQGYFPAGGSCGRVTMICCGGVA